MWRVWVRGGGCIGSWWGNRREGVHWGDLCVDVWIILGRISRRWDVGIWTGLGWSKDRDMWRTLVSAVMNLGVPWNAGNFLTSCKPFSCSGRTLHHRVSEDSSNYQKTKNERRGQWTPSTRHAPTPTSHTKVFKLQLNGGWEYVEHVPWHVITLAIDRT